MRATELLHLFGRPVAYYPRLSKVFGSTNTAILFCQFFYWHDKATSQLGIYKSVEEIEEETGLTYKEQLGARNQLKKLGVLHETNKRLEHKIYYKLELYRVDELLSFASLQKGISPNDNLSDGELTKGKPASDQIVSSLDQENTTENTTYINTPISPKGDEDEIFSQSQDVLNFYNQVANSKCVDAQPFMILLTPTKSRRAYTPEEIKLVIKWALTTWTRRSKGSPKPKNLCTVTRFDGYLSDAEQWQRDTNEINCQDVIDAYNEILGGRLPFAELNRHREKAIYNLLDDMTHKTLEAFKAYFARFSNVARPHYFGASDGWKANFDYLMKSDTLTRTREGVL